MAISSTSPLINTGNDSRFLQRRSAAKEAGEGPVTQLMPIKSGPVRVPETSAATTTKVETSKVATSDSLSEARGPKQPIKVPWTAPTASQVGNTELPISLPPLDVAASRSAGSFVNLKA